MSVSVEAACPTNSNTLHRRAPVGRAAQPATLVPPASVVRKEKIGAFDAPLSAGPRLMQASSAARPGVTDRPRLATQTPEPVPRFARKSSPPQLGAIDRGDDVAALMPASAEMHKRNLTKERAGQDREVMDLQQEAKEHSAWPWTSSQQEALDFQALPETVPTSPIGSSTQTPVVAPMGAAAEAYPQKHMQALVETVELDVDSAPLAVGEQGLWERAAKGNEEVLAALSALRESLCSQITTHCRQQLVQLRGDLEEQCNLQHSKMRATVAAMSQQHDQWRATMEGTLQEDMHRLKRDVSLVMEHQDLTHSALQAAMADLREEYEALNGKALQEGTNLGSADAMAISSMSANRLRQEIEAETKQRCNDVTTLHLLLYKEVAELRKYLEVDMSLSSTRPASLNLPVGSRGSREVPGTGSVPSRGRTSSLNPPSGLQYQSGARGVTVSINLPPGGAGSTLLSSAAPPPPSGVSAGAPDSIRRFRSVGREGEPISPKLRGLSSPVGCNTARNGPVASGLAFRSITSTGSTSVGGTSSACSSAPRS